MLKLNYESAAYFKELLNGKDTEDLKQDIQKDIQAKQPVFHYSDQDMKDIYQDDLEELEAATALYGKMKPVKPEKYAVNPWGYEQTNLNNLTVVGTVRGSVIALANFKVFSISKAKYNKKASYTRLNDVIFTSWKPAYTSEELQENAQYNAAYGYQGAIL